MVVDWKELGVYLYVGACWGCRLLSINDVSRTDRILLYRDPFHVLVSSTAILAVLAYFHFYARQR